MKIVETPRYKAGLIGIAATVGALGAMALGNLYLARKTKEENPPEGKFVEVRGVRLHFIARGRGPEVVFLHGNGSMMQDFECSGILDALTSKFRVIVFDRPGYGHSTRPRETLWTPQRQASLIADALTEMGIESAIVLGHSWGTLIALELAVREPKTIKGLVLLSGYYFPTARVDAALASIGAVPILGDVLRHTLWPIIGRLTWTATIRNLFSPRKVPAKFSGFPKEMALRPSQLRASAEEAALMVPSTLDLEMACKRLKLPVAIVCGAGDQVVDPQQSKGLHGVLSNSTLATLLFNGHMIHHTATDQVVAAINDVALRSAEGLRAVGWPNN